MANDGTRSPCVQRPAIMEEGELKSELSSGNSLPKPATEPDIASGKVDVARAVTDSMRPEIFSQELADGLLGHSSLEPDPSRVPVLGQSESKKEESIGLGIESTSLSDTRGLSTGHLDRDEDGEISTVEDISHTSSTAHNLQLQTEEPTSTIADSKPVLTDHSSQDDMTPEPEVKNDMQTISVEDEIAPVAELPEIATIGLVQPPTTTSGQDHKSHEHEDKDGIQTAVTRNEIPHETAEYPTVTDDLQSVSMDRTDGNETTVKNDDTLLYEGTPQDEDILQNEDTTKSEPRGSPSSTSIGITIPPQVNHSNVPNDAVMSSPTEPILAWSSEHQIDPAWGTFSGQIGIDHTNSFPDVPEISKMGIFKPVEPLPRSQVGDVIEEMEHDQARVDILNSGEDGHDSWTIEKDESGNDGSNFFTGVSDTDIAVPATPLDDEAKFEEGLPLVSHAEETMGAQLDQSGAFFDNKDDGEDFFTKLSSPTKEEESSFDYPRALDRKSTQQVLAAAGNTASPDPDERLDDYDKEEPSMTLLETNGQNPFDESFEESNVANGEERDRNIVDAPTHPGDLALWEAILDDDELLEDEPGVDPSAFFDEDGEGFLDETEQTSSSPPNAGSASNQPPDENSAPRYAPIANISQYPGSGSQSYAPTGYAASPVSLYNRGQSPFTVQPMPQPSAPERAQSFSDKSKGGYSSPYDAPMDLSRPKRKPTVTYMQSSGGRDSPTIPPPPPRTSSMQSASSTPIQSHINYMPSPTTAFNPNVPSPIASAALPPAPAVTRPQPKSSASSFFEELPAVSKPRPSNMNRFAQATSYQAPPAHMTPPPQMIPPPQMVPSQIPPVRPQHAPPIASNQNSQPFGLVQAERVLPFSDTSPPNLPPQQGPVPSSRYSPGPVSQPQQSNNTRYAASGPNPPPRAPSVSHVLPFQPRTSSPLARSASATQQYRPPAHLQGSGVPDGGFPTGARRPSLKTMQTAQPTAFAGLGAGASDPTAASRATTYHHPLQQNQIMTPGVQTFDLSGGIKSSLLDTVPPRSDIETTNKPQARSRNNTETQQPQTIAQASISQQTSKPRMSGHLRGPSIHESMNFIPPADGSEDDPLKRWHGVPIFSFGFGGNIVTSFPNRVPRYAAGQVIPMIKCSPGEIKVNSGKLLPLEDHIASFPGPLKSKNKKKDVLAWLQKRIHGLEQEPLQESPNISPTDAFKRRDEKVLLWKLLHILVENDGAIDANPAIENAVRNLLSPGLMSDNTAGESPELRASSSGISQSSIMPQAENKLDSKPIAALKRFLLQGEREKAIWHAVDQKLWGHAMMIASTLSRDIWKQVAQEFVRHGVKATDESSQSLAALYDVFAGNWEESVDELVPPSARAGLQMVSKSTTGGPARNALEGLDRWRETLSLILSNRSPDDTKSMAALGQLLATYGRIEAAHICFMFSKLPGLFGGPDDPQATVVLLGANHRQQPFEYAKDFDSILLTQIYEFAYAVLSPSASSSTTPHLQAFKLYHAELLAEYGYRDESQQYCDAIGNTLKSTTKASPYFHPGLFSALDDLSSRLRQAPKDGSGSWISKPSMDKVSGSVWNRFTQFVSGDDSDAASVTSARLEADGPFARVNGATPPTVSRVPSPGDAYGSYALNNGFVPSTGPAAPSNSRYAPASTYTPRSSLETSTSYTGLSSEPSSPPDLYRKPAIGNHQHLPQPANSIFPIEQEMPVSTLPTQLRYSPEVASHGTFGVQSSSITEPLTSSSLSDGDRSRPSSHHGQYSNIREQLLSPNDQRQKSQHPSPITDRYSPSYQPRSSSYAPRSASYEPRSASYEPKSATYEPRSYEPSPVGEKLLPRSPGDMVSPSYEPTAPMNKPEFKSQDNASSYEPPSYSYEPPSAPLETPVSATSGHDRPASSSYAPDSSSYVAPTFGYEPPSYDPETNGDISSPVKSPTKKKSFMDLSDDEGDFTARAAALKKTQKAEKDREADEAFRKAAEADAQRGSKPAPPLNSKPSWFGGLWGGGKAKESADIGSASGGKTKPIKARLGEESSFYYDDQLKKWVNKKAGSDAATPSAPTPPPPKGPPSRAVSSGPPGMTRVPTSNPSVQLDPPSGPPSGPPSAVTSRNVSPNIGTLVSPTSTAEPSAPPLPATGSSSGGVSGLPAVLAPPSRPGTGMSGVSNASSIDDLIGAPQARAGGTIRRAKKKKGYVDVMAK